MAPLIYLDTHVVVWLYAEGVAGVPDGVARRIETADEVRISPMVRLEMQYLYEIGRLAEGPLRPLDALEAVLGLSVCDAPFPAIVREAEQQAWTRDPFDRLIVAQAALQSAPLLTRDETILANYPGAVWESEGG